MSNKLHCTDSVGVTFTQCTCCYVHWDLSAELAFDRKLSKTSSNLKRQHFLDLFITALEISLYNADKIGVAKRKQHAQQMGLSNLFRRSEIIMM